MPHHMSTKKRLRKSKTENAYNRHYRSMMRTAIKKVITSQTKEDAEKNYLVAQKVIDKLITKGIVKKNNAAHKKSKLMRHVNSL